MQRVETSLGQWLTDEEGAVTVDWIVLTAVMVGLGLGVTLTVRQAMMDPAQGIAARIDAVDVGG